MEKEKSTHATLGLGLGAEPQKYTHYKNTAKIKNFKNLYLTYLFIK